MPPPAASGSERGGLRDIVRERFERESSIAGVACACGPLRWAAGRTIGRAPEELPVGVSQRASQEGEREEESKWKHRNVERQVNALLQKTSLETGKIGF